jgi:hypothetical protein
MNRQTPARVAIGTAGLALCLLFFWTWSVNNKAEQLKVDVGQLQDSLASLRRVTDSLRAQSAGLGEYMSTVQLHAAKLWFAGQASNWKLSKYELDELAETIEAAEGLHAQRNGVDISSVLQGVRLAQLPLFDQAISRTNLRTFGETYDQLLAACNNCHRLAGYEFIHIIPPTREPVTNQQWKVVDR